MSTLTLAYCHFCEAVASFFRKTGKGLNHFLTATSYARASAELARQGYHAESKALMMELKSIREKY